MSIYIIGVRKMKKEIVKNIAIVLLSVIFIFHSIEKKVAIDELEEENTTLKSKVSLMKYTKKIADSLMFDTTQHALDLAARLAIYEKTIEEYESNKHKVTVTMYHPVAGQTDDTPNITADGSVIKISKASEYRYVAVSRNMLIRYGGFLRYGDYVWVNAGKKSGVYQVRDTMAPRWINRIDILETPGVKPYKYNDASLRRLDYASKNL
jgi:3D (Asp-Asp-Asp) domain-containing protein